MLTSPATDSARRATPAVAAPSAVAYPAYRPYAAEVTRVLPIGRHLVRVSFTSDDFAEFGTTGLDQRIKIVFPLTPGAPLADLGQYDDAAIRAGDWYARWRALADDDRPAFRTYTVRAIDPAARRLDVDMVLHPPAPGGDGPAARWLRAARPGDRVLIVGPDARTADPTVGCDWRPGDANTVLLMGDETAAPAILSIMESLAPGIRAQAFIEVASSADIQRVVPTARQRVAWLARDAGCETAQGFQAVAPRGELLQRSLENWVGTHRRDLTSALDTSPIALDDIDVDTELLWDSPVELTGSDFYAWIAGEAAVIKRLRRYLVSDVGVSRRAVAFMGYWREGRSEGQ